MKSADEISSIITSIEDGKTVDELNLKLNEFVGIASKIKERMNINSNFLKTNVTENAENIVEMYKTLREVKEGMEKSKRGLESITSQTIM